jgi:Holliday junction resolvase-like predicted endonuclease
MFSASSRSKDSAAQEPVFIVSHSKQEKICKEVYGYLIRKKVQKLKEAVLQFNTLLKKILQ